MVSIMGSLLPIRNEVESGSDYRPCLFVDGIT